MREKKPVRSLIDRVGIWRSVLDLSLDELHQLYAEIGERIEELMQIQEMEATEDEDEEE